ncbi:MAG: hypothetical protein A2W35_02615 [Chloroflexi bacterium RBG_16_57_11]|nr:MAG: hypothetical protein A2W35_02615 [Chloroflexi bacterium RBG_16_57_11]
MHTMQAFYDKLFSPKASQSAYLSGLVRLTQVSLREIGALKSSITWDFWNAGNTVSDSSTRASSS